MFREAVSFAHNKLSRGVVNARYSLRGNPSDDFLAEDWDVLVLLDACRADYYERQTPFDGEVETRWAPGSSSQEFFERVFLEHDLHDTVYVTPNPHLYMLDGETFHHVEDCRDAWDETLQTVHPDEMTEICRGVAREFPDKRLIFHYMQPHAPYVGETADRIRTDHQISGWQPDHVSDGVPDDRDRPLVWDLAKDGTITWETVRRAYAETLDAALDSVDALLEDLDGRVVVSADHGELLGERLVPLGPREWAHTKGLDAIDLRRVPWHVVQDGERRDHVPEPPIAREDLESDAVTDRLVAMGYKADKNDDE